MKPIELPQITIDACLNGAEYIIVPIDDSIEPIFNKIDKQYDCIRYKYACDGHTSIRSYKEFLKEWCPLQPNEEYYVAEKFDIVKVEVLGDDEIVF